MGSLAPEALLGQWLGEHTEVVNSVIFAEPIRIPYERLATIDGWSVWLGYPPVPDSLPILPAPESLLWNEPETAIAAGLLVAADYAIRRGATDVSTARALLQRESPVAIIVPDELSATARTVLDDAIAAGIPVVVRRVDSARDLVTSLPSFSRREQAHAVAVGRLHDPALSFQIRVPDITIGGNPHSSFIVHNEPERDAVTVTGELNERVGIEIGLSGNGITIDTTAHVEVLAATIPSFLDGLTSVLSEQSLTIGWREGRTPEPAAIGEVFRAWLKAFTGASTVDVRIAFAPAKTNSALLSRMRVRAAEFREYRNSVIAGEPVLNAEVSSKLRSDVD